MSESKKTVFVVGLGPGGGQFLTVQAQSCLRKKPLPGLPKNTVKRRHRFYCAIR